MKSKSKVTLRDSLSMDEDTKLWVLLSESTDVVLRAWQKELNQYGISPIEAVTLWVIQVLDEMATPAEISRWILRKSHTASELVNRMEKGGLVRKTKNLRRRNSVRVSITDKGKQVYHKARQREAIHTAMSVLCEEERKQLMTSLEKIRSIGLKQLGLEELEPRLP
jgi:DNA-binding MarR family transcriptional regulator